MQIVNYKNSSTLRIVYILSDILSTTLAWFLFNLIRQDFLGLDYTSGDPKYWISLILYTFGWMGLFCLAGYYNHPHTHSRLSDILTTLVTSFWGCIILLFVMILNDAVSSYKAYIESFFILFFIQFILTATPKIIITTKTLKKFDRRKIIYPTLVIGSGNRARNITEELERHHSNGFYIVGYIKTDDDNLVDSEQILASYNDETEDFHNKLKGIIVEHNVRNVIISPDHNRQRCASRLLPTLIDSQVNIYLSSDSYDLAIGQLTDIFSIPFIPLSRNKMPQWERNIKWLLDKFVAIIAIIILSPLLIYTALKIHFGSEGPIIYKQKRIGLKGKTFYIFKFRSMYVSNEQGHNLHLTGDDDPRIAGKWGHTMRKYRIDELPQFFNILKGDMSLVGFRPEQPYFVEQLIKNDPKYAMLYCLKPGITSMGMVKYGYAKNINEMLKRAQYDYLYIENCSLAMDIKIIFYTIKTVVLGKGK